MSGREAGSEHELDKLNRSWLRLRLRQLRTFVSIRRSRAQSSRGHHASVPSDTKRVTEPEAQPEENGEGDDNLYSSMENLDNDEEMAIIRAVSQMSKHGWYWGGCSRHAAQRRLHGTPNGSFLVRNSQINRNSFTVSFRTAGNTLHHRIEFAEGFWKIENSRYRSIVDLIEDAIAKSKDSVFCYVKPTSQLQPPFPVRLTNPLSHFGEISSLQSMCRQVIQKHVENSRMELLPLPYKLIEYCKQWGTNEPTYDE